MKKRASQGNGLALVFSWRYHKKHEIHFTRHNFCLDFQLVRGAGKVYHQARWKCEYFWYRRFCEVYQRTSTPPGFFRKDEGYHQGEAGYGEKTLKRNWNF